jgi:hypothetical protein
LLPNCPRPNDLIRVPVLTLVAGDVHHRSPARSWCLTELGEAELTADPPGDLAPVIPLRPGAITEDRAGGTLGIPRNVAQAARLIAEARQLLRQAGVCDFDDI